MSFKARAGPRFPDDRGGCYLLTSDSTLAYYNLREKRLRTYPLPDIKGIRGIGAFADGSVYLRTKKAIYRGTSANPSKLVPLEGLPADILVSVWKSSSKFFFRTARQIGWVEGGRVSLVDTLRYPQLKGVTFAAQDRAGRMFFYRTPDKGPMREVWMLDRETLKNLSLPGSSGFEGAKFVSGDDEMILTAIYECRIYRYSREHEQFYLLQNTGDFFGYLWGGFIADGNLIVSGWGKRFLKIDLRAARPAIPRLSFQTISVDKKEVGEQDRHTLAARSVLRVSYVGIEKLDQSRVRYQTRLIGQDTSWSEPTRNESIELRNLPARAYRLEIRASGESGVWGKPIGLDFGVLPPWYATVWAYLGYAITFAGCLLGTVKITRRRLDRRRAIEEMRKELDTAHEMQMSLMPKEPPQVEGLDLAGCCIPANHVGGDYFQYFHQNDKLILSLADVTGHAMEAAIPVVMFSGILKSHMELSGALQERFERLNRSIYGAIRGRTLVCLAMGELDLSTHTLTLSDSGCPYPYHYRASTEDMVELVVDAYPLGVRPDTEYPVVETQLQVGDRVVFCSDGIAEASNAAGEQFGYERTAGAIRGACEEGLSAEGTIDRILGEVTAFRGGAPQADDMTCVVVRIEA